MPTSACFEWVVGELTAKEMEGRGAGTAGLERAAGLIEREFGALGLEPPGGSHRQPFEVGTHPVESRLSLAGIPTKLGSEHVPLAFSASGEFTGRLDFVGYGIRAPGLGYDDYAGLDLRGKIALAMRYGPGVADEANPDGGALLGRWSDLQYKAQLAHEASRELYISALGSMFTVFFQGGPVANLADARRSDTAAHAAYFHGMLDRGIYLPPSQFEVQFVSAAHSDADVDLFLEAAAGALR